MDPRSEINNRLDVKILESAMELQSLGFSVLPLERKDNRCTKEYQAVPYIPCDMMEAAFAGKNVGIVLGVRSFKSRASDGFQSPYRTGVPNYPFVAECASWDALAELRNWLGGRVRWIAQMRNKIVVLLLSPDGRINPGRARTSGVRFITKGVYPVPPSCDESGAPSRWLIQDGALPGYIGEDYIRLISRHAKVKWKYSPPSPGIPVDFIHPLIGNYLVWAEAYEWPRKYGAILKWLFIGLCHRANVEKPQRFRATARELCEITGLSTRTIRNHLKRLLKLKIIRRARKRKKQNKYSAHEYALFKLKESPLRHDIPETEFYLWMFQNHDAFRAAALNWTGAILYDALLRQSFSSLPKLAMTVRLTPPTVRSCMHLLIENGLVCEEKGTFRGVPYDPFRLDEIAERYGTAGTHKRTKDQHIRQRVEFAYWKNCRRYGLDPMPAGWQRNSYSISDAVDHLQEAC